MSDTPKILPFVPPAKQEQPVVEATPYVEFAVASNFSFLRGASHSEELILQAAHLQLTGLGLCDRNTVAGVVRAYLVRREQNIPLKYHAGARLVFDDGTPDILAYPRDRAAWGRLCRLLTQGNLRAEKGDCILHLDDLITWAEGLELIVMPECTRETPAQRLHKSRTFFGEESWLGEEKTIAAPEHDCRPREGGDPVNAGLARTDRQGVLDAHLRGHDTPNEAITSKKTLAPPPPLRGRSDRAAVREGGQPHSPSAIITPLPNRGPHRASATGCPTPPQGGRERAEHGASETKHPLHRLRDAAPGRVRLAACMLYRGNDRARIAARAKLAAEIGIPLIAVNDVLYHDVERRPLQDVLTCIREHLTIDKAGRKLAANAERYLKPGSEMARLFEDYPDAIAETARLSDRLTFTLKELETEYPEENRAGFASPQAALEYFTWEGAKERYPKGIPDKTRDRIKHEFGLIARRDYAPYFLTVHHIVQYARSQGILCQGRGSAANSAVCFCLGITEVDPSQYQLLFERFISENRGEPPDIDVDFEHERREEVIQHIYEHYGREKTGIAATVISYRGRSAIREVGKVFGLSEDMIGALASSIWGMGGGNVRQSDLLRTGLDPKSARVKHVIACVNAIQKFPRHLSQHVGGFVITRSRLDEVVPIMNGAMDKRTHVEWDKDDLDALNLLKVDVLGLGMLTCIRKAFELLEKHYLDALPARSFAYSQELAPPAFPPPLRGRDREGGTFDSTEPASTPLPNPPPQGGREQTECVESEPPERKPLTFTIASIPSEQKAVYAMLQRADSIGVFQVESRAQMSMLPRLKPKRFYDLVIEVAIVRPGPIQGDMVHPYLRRREGKEPVIIPSPKFGKKDQLQKILKRTLGVPLFQEQAMSIAIEAGGFEAAEADKLRRAMATFKRTGTIDKFRERMVEGMVKNGYERDFAVRCFKQIEGFGEYGFPESHAASFALLVYASAWLKCRYPDVFTAALLNSQPMGFYAPAQIVRDAREHGVKVHPVDINHSHYDATLEPGPRAARRVHAVHHTMKGDIRATHALRLGMRAIKGVSEEDADKIVAGRTLPPPERGRSDCEAIRVGVAIEGSKDDPHPTPPPQGGREQSVPCAHNVFPYISIRDLWLRTGLKIHVLERLADADAFGSLGLTRRQALWAVKALGRAGDQDDLPLMSSSPSPLRGGSTRNARRGGGDADALAMPSTPNPSPQGGGEIAAANGVASVPNEPHVTLPAMPLGEEVVNDYRFLSLSLRAHPASFLRKDLAARGIIPNAQLRTRSSGALVTVSGLVTIRQRPGSANVTFLTIEDETAIANIIVWPRIFERFRPVILGARFIAATGKLQHESGVIHVVSERLEDLTPMLKALMESAPPIEAFAHADAVKHPHSENRERSARPRSLAAFRHPRDQAGDIAAHLDVPAHGTAHAPTQRAR